jgi:hypothetical protein
MRGVRWKQEGWKPAAGAASSKPRWPTGRRIAPRAEEGCGRAKGAYRLAEEYGRCGGTTGGVRGGKMRKMNVEVVEVIGSKFTIIIVDALME